MELERRAIEIRPRSPWEACDLGIQMGRHWWWPMVKIWLALAAPWILLSWLVPAQYVALPGLFYWLGKPLWERFLLHFLSQAIFANELSTAQVLKLAPRLLAKDWLAAILWRRLSLWRAYTCALTVLEGQTGKNRRQRLQHLAGENASTAAKVALLLAHMEGFLVLALWVAGYALVPRSLEWNLPQLHELLASDAFAAGYNTLYILVSALVAPFFVATGFSLYLNRRIWLEAWDLDISFKTLAQRLGPSLLLILLCACLWTPALAPQARAQEQAQPQEQIQLQEQAEAQEQAQVDDIQQALDLLAHPERLFAELQPAQALNANYPAEQAKIASILAGEDFHQKHTQLVHHWRWQWQQDDHPSATSAHWEQLIASVARVLEVLLWTLVLALILWLSVNYRSLLARFGSYRTPANSAASPQEVFGLDIRPSSLPDSPAEVALQLCLAGDYRQCLALLYRATLVALLQQGLDLKPSHTEEDCLALAGAALNLTPAARAYLLNLTHHWQRLAYGHQAPDPALAQQLCRNWAEHWNPPREFKGAAHV